MGALIFFISPLTLRTIVMSVTLSSILLMFAIFFASISNFTVRNGKSLILQKSAKFVMLEFKEKKIAKTILKTHF